jgi:hypothetical protein
VLRDMLANHKIPLPPLLRQINGWEDFYQTDGKYVTEAI